MNINHSPHRPTHETHHSTRPPSHRGGKQDHHQVHHPHHSHHRELQRKRISPRPDAPTKFQLVWSDLARTGAAAAQRVPLGTGTLPGFGTGHGQFTVFAPHIVQFNPHSLKLATLEVSKAMGATANMSDILVSIKSENHEIRVAAIHALQACVHRLDADLVAKVIPTLQDAHPEVRKTALLILGRAGEDSSVETRTKAVCSCLHDANVHVRRQALFALKHIGAKPELYLRHVVDLLQDPDTIVKGTALHVLPCLMGAAQPGAQHLAAAATGGNEIQCLQDDSFKFRLVQRLVNCLIDENADIRRETLHVLERMPELAHGEKCIRALVQILADPHMSVVISALHVLEQIRQKHLPQLSHAFVIDGILKLFSDERVQVRRLAIVVVTGLSPYIAHLEADLGDIDIDAQAKAAGGGGAQTATETETATETAQERPNKRPKLSSPSAAAAAAAAAASASASSSSSSTTTSTSPSPADLKKEEELQERLIAGKFDPGDVNSNSRIKQISLLLWDADSGMRRGAVHSVASMGPHAMVWLKQHHNLDTGHRFAELLEEDDVAVRRTVLHCLLSMPKLCCKCRLVVIEELKHADAEIRRAAVYCLRSLGTTIVEQYVTRVLPLLHDQAREVRVAALHTVYCLGPHAPQSPRAQRKPPDVVLLGALTEAVKLSTKDPSAVVAGAAKQALRAFVSEEEAAAMAQAHKRKHADDATTATAATAAAKASRKRYDSQPTL